MSLVAVSTYICERGCLLDESRKMAMDHGAVDYYFDRIRNICSDPLGTKRALDAGLSLQARHRWRLLIPITEGI